MSQGRGGGGELAAASAASASQSAQRPTSLAERGQRKMRCNVELCQNRDGHGTKPRQEGVSQHLIAFSVGDESPSVSCIAFSCAETSGAFCSAAPGPAAIATPPGLASQADRRTSNGCNLMISRLSCFREASLLQSANMTPKFEDGKVRSVTGCHVHGAELPTEWCM